MGRRGHGHGVPQKFAIRPKFTALDFPIKLRTGTGATATRNISRRPRLGGAATFPGYGLGSNAVTADGGKGWRVAKGSPAVSMPLTTSGARDSYVRAITWPAASL